MKKKLLFLVCILIGVNSLFCQHHHINVASMSFDPDTLFCYLGDSVTINLGGYHDAVEVDETTWIANGTTPNGGFNIPIGTPSGTFIIDTVKTYYYVCTPHVTFGMKAVIVSSAIAQIYGCTDSTAVNYDSLATIDDGSCVYYLSSHTNIFFSEWGEGNSWNKYFEIYNPTNDTVHLSNYGFPSVSNSPSTQGVYEYWNDFDSSSVILPNDVFIVAHYLADSSILQHADMLVYSPTALGNGDDGIALIYGSEPVTPSAPSDTTYRIIDWIGDWNGNPSQGWTVSGVLAATTNHTIIRKCNITQGDTSWTNSSSDQWIVKSSDYWNNLGLHDYNITIVDSQSYTICIGDSLIIGSSTYSTTGNYIDTFVSTFGCDSLVYTNLQYYPATSLNISSLPSPAEICLGDTILLEASIGFSEYYWTYSNAIIGQNQNILLSPTEDTWYLLKAIDQYGCLVQEDIWVYVDTCFVSSVDLKINNIKIYPNPSIGILNIEFNKGFENNLSIRIVNSLGKVVVSEVLKKGEKIKEFNLSEFSKGVYIIEMQTEIGLYKKKIILK